jgi:hypothetical protein
MRFSWKMYAICVFILLLHSSVFANQHTKSLFFRVDLEQKMVHFGHFETQKHKIKAIESKKMVAYTENDVAEVLKNELDSTLKNHKALIFIHGMWGNRQLTLNDNIPELETNYGSSNDVIIHIIWESQSLNERRCRKNALNSTTFITPILRGVLDVENVSSTLMCHSMGNYLFFELIDGLQTIAQPFEKIFLLAPDVALPVFNKKLDILGTVGKTTQVFYNKKDLILFFSGVANGEKRLGRKGVTVDRNFIEITDCTKDKNYGFIGRITQHSYFKRCHVVRESLKKQINS